MGYSVTTDKDQSKHRWKSSCKRVCKFRIRK